MHSMHVASPDQVKTAPLAGLRMDDDEDSLHSFLNLSPKSAWGKMKVFHRSSKLAHHFSKNSPDRKYIYVFPTYVILLVFNTIDRDATCDTMLYYVIHLVEEALIYQDRQIER